VFLCLAAGVYSEKDSLNSPAYEYVGSNIHLSITNRRRRWNN
jgi:hypothetical protein